MGGGSEEGSLLPDGDHPYEADTLILQTDFEEAYWIAQGLWNWPASFGVPKDGAPGEETISQPDKPKELWSSDMTIRRDMKGKVETMSHFTRGYAWGCHKTIAREKSGEISLKELCFGD